MTLDGIVAVVGLLFAAYQIMPRHRQLDLGLRFGAFDWIVLIFALLAFHYFQFYPFFEKIGGALHHGSSWWGISPGQASYLVILVAVLVVSINMWRSRLTVRRMPKFLKLVRELMWGRQFHEVSLLLERHLGPLLAIYRGEFRFARLRTRMLMHTQPLWFRLPEQVIEATHGKAVFEPRHPRWAAAANRLKESLARLLPSHESECDLAREFASQVLVNKEFVAFIAKNRPYLGVDIARQDLREQSEFLNVYLQAMLADPSSMLYHEIRNNQNLSHGDAYDIPPENRILSAFVADANFAKDKAVYRPIGEYMIRELDGLSHQPDSDPYNLPMEDFQDAGCWESSLWVGVRFFDIMVSRALYAGVEWHMWLYYFDPITKRICRNYRLNERQAGCRDEFPSRYSYLLYSIFSSMESWVSAVEHVPLEQANVKLAFVSTDLENGNIPKSSITVMGRCLRIVLVAESIPERFRKYVLSQVWRLYFKLRQQEKLADYARVLLLSVGTCASYDCDNRDEYYRLLLEGLNGLDRVTYDSDHIAEARQVVTELAGQ